MSSAFSPAPAVIILPLFDSTITLSGISSQSPLMQFLRIYEEQPTLQ